MRGIKTTYIAATLIAACALMPAAGFASDTPERQFSAKAGEPVSAALGLINDGDHASALAKLSQVIGMPDLNAYERSMIYQMQGSSYNALGQTGQAITAFEKAVQAGGLLPEEAAALRSSTAQLHILNGSFAVGAQMLEDEIKVGAPPTPQIRDLIMQAWVQSENYAKALPWAEQWFEGANPKERKHYDLLNFLYSHLKQPGKQARIVTQMLRQWPQERELWEGLASLYSDAGREVDAFDVNKEMYFNGLLTTERELLKLAQYYSYHGIPYHGAKMLTKEMDEGRVTKSPENLTQLSNMWRQAREYKRAIPVLREAAKRSDDKKLYADLGEALIKENDCQGAQAAFDKSVERGYPPAKPSMLMGTCHYEIAQQSERLSCEMTPDAIKAAPRTVMQEKAMAAFGRVPAGSSEAGNAKKWTQFIRAERQTFKDRCVFIAKLQEERCNADIKQAYTNIIFEGTFKLSDDECAEFKPAYDAKYRVRLVSEYE